MHKIVITNPTEITIPHGNLLIVFDFSEALNIFLMEMVHKVTKEIIGDKHHNVVGKQNKHKIRNTPTTESRKMNTNTKYP
jgi:hypothetical protein